MLPLVRPTHIAIAEKGALPMHYYCKPCQVNQLTRKAQAIAHLFKQKNPKVQSVTPEKEMMLMHNHKEPIAILSPLKT